MEEDTREVVGKAREVVEEREAATEDYTSKEINANGLNLFSHKLAPIPLSEQLVLLVCGLVLVPVRLVLAVLVMLVTWLVSVVGLAGRDREEFHRRPQGGWRGRCREFMFTATSSVILWCLGFRLRVEGEAVAREEAPVVICAPHTSFLDVFIIAICRGSPVARIENSRTPGMSAIQSIGHTIFVDRRREGSRREAGDTIVARATSSLPWPQVFIFAEGTTTNGSALIRFQTGGFRPGTPVQPVTVRYSHPGLTVWTRDQKHGLLRSFVLLLAIPSKTVTVSFLPPHAPTAEQAADPILFAKAVQRRMAEELGVPATDIQRAEFVRETRKKQ